MRIPAFASLIFWIGNLTTGDSCGINNFNLNAQLDKKSFPFFLKKDAPEIENRDPSSPQQLSPINEPSKSLAMLFTTFW